MPALSVRLAYAATGLLAVLVLPCPAAPEVLARLSPIATAHAGLPLPEGTGRAVGQKKG